MERRYENSLTSLLETIAYEGLATKAKWKITRWYNQTNFSVTIRRDLRERWEKLLRDDLNWSKVPPLRMAEVSGSIVFLKGSDFYPDKE